MFNGYLLPRFCGEVDSGSGSGHIKRDVMDMAKAGQGISPDFVGHADKGTPRG